ncbi:MAG: hypothetical protein NT159_23940 [Proteobacteria bacterium]|nr:hypothetical protein [Pseudomonadota bacterium]
MTNDRLRRYAGIAGLLAVPLLVPALLHDSFSRTSPATSCASVKITATSGSERFSLERLAMKGGTPVYAGAQYSQIGGGGFNAIIDAPLSARGRTELPDTARVWTVLSGDKSGYYLQSPPVEIRDGLWVAANLRPGCKIAKIQFLEVDTEADKLFSERAKRKDWGEFPQLPTGARELAALTLE